MLIYVLRRLVASVLTLLIASGIVYFMVINSGDPLGFLNEITNPTERELQARLVTDALNLNEPQISRYFSWLGNVLQGDFGISARSQQPVTAELKLRLPVTLKLVTAATLLSIVLGTIIGVVTALRQYSGFDYVVTLSTFVFFSLPVFWLSVILKEFGAIQLNDWLRGGATFPIWLIIAGGFGAGGLGYVIIGGPQTRRLIGGALVGASGAAILFYLSAVGWFLNPGIGFGLLIPLSIGTALVLVALFAGFSQRRVLYSALTAAAVGIGLYFPLQQIFDAAGMNIWWALGLGVIAIVGGMVIGYLYGGFDKGLSARVAALTSFAIGSMIFVDRLMQEWNNYSASRIIRGRPIKTIGDRELRLEGSFWLLGNDVFSHLLLPTISLVLISLAGYTRYARASMLEVLNADYMRTARAKGLTERTIIIRHGLRNALIPIATIVAFDIGALLGGAVITETVFQWNGTGTFFVEGLTNFDPNPVMAVVVIVGATAIGFNFVADVAYSILDPRIRIDE